jgi:CubicO group peptidase (beta-lactamase class C family)
VSRVLPRSTPEAQGVSSASVLRFVEALESGVTDAHSVMLLRHGHVIAEGWWAPYAEQLPHSLFSISKSFTATAVGFAIADGLLALDDAVVELLRDDAPPTVGGNLAAMTVRHLLTMTTGHAVDSVDAIDAGTVNWVAALLALPVPLTPGERFVYDSGATYLLSAIIRSVTGERLLDYLTPRLFEPLGIVGATWEQCPRGIDTGGWGLSVTTEDVAAFGQTHLDGGHFGGVQVVPEDWVRAATALQVENGDHGAGDDNAQGYGFQFWRGQHGSYRADGAFGQIAVAYPEQDALLVVTGGLVDKQRELNTAWDHLLPVLGSHDPLPENPAAHEALRERLAGLSLGLPPGESSSPLAAGVGGRRYGFPANAGSLASARLDFGEGTTALTVVDSFGEHSVELGHGRWVAGSTAAGTGVVAKVAGAGAWSDASAYLAVIRFVETPFAVSVSFDFRGDEVTVNAEQNVSFGATQLLRSVGRAESSQEQE